MKCFFHRVDLDGRCSGAIVKVFYPECELIGINYGEPFPWETIQADDVVYMVDFSLQPFSDMIRLQRSCAMLVWIDHHISAIKERDLAGVPFNGFQLDGEAGCELTWKYLSLVGQLPRAVYLLGRYDVWQWQNVPGAMEFQTGLWQYDTDPNNSEFWNRLLHNDALVDEIIQAGSLLLAAKKKDNAARVKTLAFDTELDGLRLLAINHGMTNSTVFDDAYDPERHDGMLSFCWYRDHWKVSLYADKPDVDVSVICKARGGGGHKGASGFKCEFLPFSLGAA